VFLQLINHSHLECYIIYIYINIDRVKPQVTYRGSLICKTHVRFDFDHFYGSWELFLYLFIIKKNWQKRNNFRLVEKFSCFSKRNFFYFVLYFLKVEQIQKYNVINRLYQI